jgi:hypothetical protein
VESQPLAAELSDAQEQPVVAANQQPQMVPILLFILQYLFFSNQSPRLMTSLLFLLLLAKMNSRPIRLVVWNLWNYAVPAANAQKMVEVSKRIALLRVMTSSLMDPPRIAKVFRECLNVSQVKDIKS